jgi:hypothetical protein
MMIGRTDERQNPVAPMAVICRGVEWMSFADPIWASGHAAAQQAGHMTAFEPPLNLAQSYLNLTGRPHMVHE